MIRYHLVQRKNLQKPEDTPKWYAVAANDGKESTLRNFAEDISDYTALNTPDIMSAFEGLIKIMSKEISRGKLIRMGDLGTFRITLKSEGAEAPELFTNANIKTAYIRFIPGKLLRKSLKNADYAKIEKPEK